MNYIALLTAPPCNGPLKALIPETRLLCISDLVEIFNLAAEVEGLNVFSGETENIVSKTLL